jgi:PAS domain S-box-containing protein
MKQEFLLESRVHTFEYGERSRFTVDLDDDSYRTIFEHAIEGIFRTTPGGTYISVNPALARTLGYQSPEELKSSIQNIAKQLYVDPQRRETFVRLIQEQVYVSGFVSEVYRKNRSTIWISENAHAIRDAQGNLRYYEGFVVDITDHKKANELLCQREEKYRASTNAIPDLMVLLRRDGTFLEYKAAKSIEPAFQDETFVGKHLDDVFPSQIAQSVATHIQLALKNGDIQILEYQLVVNDILYDYEMRIVVSGLNNVLAIIRNISERKKAERLKNEFVSIVSHELRTPLTSIRGSLSLIAGAMANELSPKVKSMVNIAYKNSERLVSLVNDILDIDKIESGKMIFDLKPINLIELVEQSLESNRSYGVQYGVSYIFKTSLQSVKVYADGDRLLQVIANLLSNAIKFSPRDSVISVTVKQQGMMARVSVSDHGPGIPDEFRSRIFQKFAQADSSDTRQKGGSGLGLSISKAIIEKHNGSIGFESTTNAGATFYFELPEWSDTEVTIGNLQNKPRILICEDTPDVATMLSLMLNYSGFATDIAYNTNQARQFIAHNQYAAMTLDLVMPGQSGIDFIRELRTEERTRHLPIVVISAIAQQGKQELAGGVFEVADWLDKTVDHNQLTGSIRRAITQRRKEKASVLHIEDDPDVHQIIAAILQDIATTSHARTVQEAKDLLEYNSFDLIILDLGLPDGSGIELLTLLRDPSRQPIPVLIFSAQEVGTTIAHQVAAVLVKSRTSNHELLTTIRTLIGRQVPDG